MLAMGFQFRCSLFIFGLLTLVPTTNAEQEQEEVVGTNAILVCPLQGTFEYPTWSGPPGTTQYLQEGQETSPDHPWVAYADNKRDLVISDVQLAYSGTYLCEKSVVGIARVNLSVIAKPEVQLANKTTTKPDSHFVHTNIIPGFEDKNLTVSCTATGGKPAYKLEILVNNSAIENIDIEDERRETRRVEEDETVTVILTRTFTAKRKYDMSEIVCRATSSNPSNKLGDFETLDSSMIYLSLKPLVRAYTGGGMDTLGKSRNFSCMAQSGRPAPSFTWQYDGHSLGTDRFTKHRMVYVPVQQDETVTADQTVTLKELTREDNGKKMAVTINNEALDQPDTETMEIRVNFGPTSVNITGSKGYADDGATLTLTCTTDLVSYPYNNTIRWLNGTTTEEQWYKRSINKTDIWTSTPGDYNAFYVSENLTFSIDRYMDGQSVSCETSPAEDWASAVSDSIVLDIDYPPIITEPLLDELRAVEQQKVTLLCAAWSKPPSRFSWYKEGSPSPIAEGSGTEYRNAFSYIIPSVTKSDSATYKCLATNKEGHSVEKELKLVVNDRPAVPSFGIFSRDMDTISIHFTPPSPQPILLQTYYLQYRLAGNAGAPWHEVLMPAPSGEDMEFKVAHLKPGSEFEFRIRVDNRDGTAYTDILETKTKDLPEDNITQEDVNIAIVVSVVVTAVVVLLVVGIIFCCCLKRKQGFDPSKKYEMESR